MLGDRRLACEVSLHQVVVEVYVADERCNDGAFLDIVEGEHSRSEGRVSHVQADANGRMVYGRDLLGQLGGPDRVVVDSTADDRQLGVVVFDGYRHAELFRQIPRLPQRESFGGKLLRQAVLGIAAPYPPAGVADYDPGVYATSEPDTGLQHATLDFISAQVHKVHL